jgi:hypothetical protein
LNFDRIDKLLQDWQQKAAMVSQNLLELHDMSAYQRLSDAEVRKHLPSPTQQQVNGAIEQVDRLFAYFEMLCDALEQVKELRKQAGALGAKDNLLPKITELLTTEWIVVNQQQVPLAQRGLASSLVTGELLSLDRLLAVMISLFREAVSTFTEIEQAEQNLAQNLQIARQNLQEIRALNSISSSVYLEATAKCGESGSRNLDLAEITNLADWLKNLETKFSQGSLQMVAITVQNWLVKENQMRQAEQDTINYHRGRMQLRLELRGRLLALKSKAVAKGRAEDSTLATLATEAEALLYRRPTPLDLAADLVVQYERYLNSNVN